MDHITELRQYVTDFAKTLDVPPFIHKLSELINQRAWEQAAEEEKRAMQKIADMWAIVQAVASTNSACYIEAYGGKCPFCDGKPAYEGSGIVEHEPDCIVMKARAMVQGA